MVHSLSVGLGTLKGASCCSTGEHLRKYVDKEAKWRSVVT